MRLLIAMAESGSEIERLISTSFAFFAAAKDVVLSGDPISSEIRSAAVSFFLTAVGSYLFLSRKRRQFQRFWALDPVGGRVRIVMGKFSEVPHSRGYRYTTVTAGDAEAASLVASSIAIAYVDKYKVRCFPSDHFNDEFWREPVVLVGGGRRNVQTRSYLADIGERYSLLYNVEDTDDNVERRIVDCRTGREYTASPQEPNAETGTGYTDYAVITRGPNITSARRTNATVVFYGLHAPGTIGAAQLVSHDRLNDFRGQITKAIKKKRFWPILLSAREPLFFQALVRIRVWMDDVSAEVIDAGELRRIRTKGKK